MDYDPYRPMYRVQGTDVFVQPDTSSLADEDALEKDEIGYTHPNLHRRIDPQEPSPDSGEVAPREYRLNIYGKNSYRTTVINTHDEDSETSEIP